ncbi:MAG: hypothetical protein KAR06_02490, partial [Deltaproteobacteria bacterium]|nr:hypothetical protein [Deltaproteobacteria bacterium]
MIALHWVAFLVFLAVTMPHLIVWRIRAPVGTKSLLFGVHQFIWHPITVLIAWCKLYGWPTWPELVCIIVHDWGYWGKPNMDGPEGEKH